MAPGGYETHVGDPTFGVSFSTQASDRAILSLTANAKAPVTDTASYGTGAWDFGAGASLSILSASRLFVSGSVAFWSLGDLPELELQDIWLGTVSAGTIRPSGWSFAAFLSGSSSAVAEFEAPLSAGTTVSWVRSRGSVGLSVGAGLSGTAPDVSVSLFWGLAIGGGS